MSARPAHYNSKYNRRFEAETQEYNRIEHEKKFKELCQDCLDVMTDDEYNDFVDTWPDHASYQAYIEIMETKLALLQLEPVYQDQPIFS